jgi:hypothetical protein
MLAPPDLSARQATKYQNDLFFLAAFDCMTVPLS